MENATCFQCDHIAYRSCMLNCLMPFFNLTPNSYLCPEGNVFEIIQWIWVFTHSVTQQRHRNGIVNSMQIWWIIKGTPLATFIQSIDRGKETINLIFFNHQHEIIKCVRKWSLPLAYSTFVRRPTLLSRLCCKFIAFQ